MLSSGATFCRNVLVGRFSPVSFVPCVGLRFFFARRLARLPWGSIALLRRGAFRGLLILRDLMSASWRTLLLFVEWGVGRGLRVRETAQYRERLARSAGLLCG